MLLAFLHLLLLTFGTFLICDPLFFPDKVPGSENRTTSWRKLDIFKWLLDQGVPYAEIRDLSKCSLLSRARSLNVPIRLQVEELVRGTGHTILWLPAYHAALYNPIELISL